MVRREEPYVPRQRRGGQSGEGRARGGEEGGAVYLLEEDTRRVHKESWADVVVVALELDDVLVARVLVVDHLRVVRPDAALR